MKYQWSSPGSRRGALAAVCCALTIGLAACGGTSSSSGSDSGKGQATLRVGAIASTLYLPFYVADAKGFLAKQGIKVEYVTIQNASPLIAGDVQLQLSGFDTAIINGGQGKATPIVGVLQQHNSLGLWARADKKISGTYPDNVRQLKGATIATTNRNTGAEPFLQAVLAGAGLKEGRDYTITSLGTGPNIYAALKAKRIDAGMLFPPFDSQARAENLATPLVQQALGEGPPEVVQSYGATAIANQQWLHDNPAVAKRLSVAIEQGTAYTHDPKHAEEILKIAQRYAGIDNPAAIRPSLPAIQKLSVDSFECTRAEAQVRLLKRVGLIKGQPDCAMLAAREYLPAS